mgnify:FL=1
MLVLTNSLLSSLAVSESEWTPASIENLTLWLKANNNITADQAEDNSSITRSTAAGDMVDGDKINAWNAFGSTSINAVQTTEADKPLWETDSADLGAINFFNSIKYMDLSASIVFDADTDFTIAIRLKGAGYSAKAFMGSSGTEFIRFTNTTTIRAKVNNTNRDFALASGSFATDKYVTLIVVRSDTDTGNINLYVRGADSGYFDGTATGTVVGSEIADPTEITISDIGSADNDTQNVSGFISDVMIWDGTAASSADREEIFDYIEAQ